MSKLYQALRSLEGNGQSRDPVPEVAPPPEVLGNAVKAPPEIEGAEFARVDIAPVSRLVALSAPQSLGAEKFRALAARLENIRQKHELKSFQITSSVGSEGKSFVASNLAVTLASDNKSKVLLLEGDLRKPTLGSLFGLKQVQGLDQWWSGTEEDLTKFLCRLSDMPLWFLGAGKAQERPSDMLQSDRFARAFKAIATRFDWVVVDSTPMQPIVDANLWSRLVDGTLLVVREGVTPVNALKKGLESLDNPRLVGVVLNEASEFDQANYKYAYYASK